MAGVGWHGSTGAGEQCSQSICQEMNNRYGGTKCRPDGDGWVGKRAEQKGWRIHGFAIRIEVFTD
jgi:hypothetical protein